jgi:hypothetical protein
MACFQGQWPSLFSIVAYFDLYESGIGQTAIG